MHTQTQIIGTDKPLGEGAVLMSNKSANVYARIQPEIKEEAEVILSRLGLSASSAITLFYTQIILHQGLPFELKLPLTKPLDQSALSPEQMDVELSKGHAEAKAGRGQAVQAAFAAIRPNSKK
jgi:DNA-damage-inducible protein J